MINRQKILGLVTARGGSRTVVGKNLKPLGGKPLVAWVIEAGLASELIDRLVLSSDDPDIISAGRDAGCEAPFVRPANLATDEARSIDVAHHALSELDETYDFVTLLQPTSPFVSAADIDGCIEKCHASGATSCVSISQVDKHPAWMYRLSPKKKLRPLSPGERPSRRQDIEPVFALNGAVFVARCDWLMQSDDFIGPESLGYEMPKERSVDIDTPLDFMTAEAVLNGMVNGTI